MAIFAVLSKEHNQKLINKIKEIYPNSYYEYSTNQWLISATGTAQELSDKIGISIKENNLKALVLNISSYYGRAETNLWDWMRDNWEKTDG